MEKPNKRELPREITEVLSPEEQVRLQQLTNCISELTKQQKDGEAVDFARIEEFVNRLRAYTDADQLKELIRWMENHQAQTLPKDVKIVETGE